MLQLRLLIVCVFCTLSSYSQTIYEVCNELQKLENEGPLFSFKSQNEANLIANLIDKIGLYESHIEPELLNKRLEQIQVYVPLYKIRRVFVDSITVIKNKVPKDPNISFLGLDRNLELFDNQMSRVIDKHYELYNFTDISDKTLKGFHVYHDNDVFLLFGSNLNKDRDYTGGFRIEVLTDKLKMRLFKSFNSDRFLSYQSFSLGGEGYTPHIRFDTTTFQQFGIEIIPDQDGFLREDVRQMLSDSLSTLQERTDRPFASFQYLSRGKFRMHYRGWIRSASFFKIGIVGGEIGERIQQILHQDVTTNSKRVLNWNRQIADGGRLGINVEHEIDLMLVSPNSNLFKIKQQSRKNNSLNIYSKIEGAFGNVHTYMGFGLGISNKSFLQSNSHNILKYKASKYTGKGKWFKRLWQHTYLNAEVKTRRVYHNSMLNGLGFVDRFDEDIFDDENPSVYFLSDEDTSNWFSSLKLTVLFRLRKASVYYKYTRFLNKEFKVRGEQDPTGLYSTPDNYGYGTIGINIDI